MNEYLVLYLNGIEWNVMAEDWKDAIIEAKLNAERKGFQNKGIKRIMDEDGTSIINIDVDNFHWKYSTAVTT